MWAVIGINKFSLSTLSRLVRIQEEFSFRSKFAVSLSHILESSHPPPSVDSCLNINLDLLPMTFMALLRPLLCSAGVCGGGRGAKKFFCVKLTREESYRQGTERCGYVCVCVCVCVWGWVRMGWRLNEIRSIERKWSE